MTGFRITALSLIAISGLSQNLRGQTDSPGTQPPHAAIKPTDVPAACMFGANVQSPRTRSILLLGIGSLALMGCLLVRKERMT
jgi:hypothetical protein